MVLLMLVFMGGGSSAAEDDKQLIKKMEEVLLGLRDYEMTMKSKTYRKIQKKNKNARNELMGLMSEEFKNNDGKAIKDPGGLQLRRRDNRLRKWVSQTRSLKIRSHGSSGGGVQENEHFKYRVHYAFAKDSLIKGTIMFIPGNKLRLIYDYRGKRESRFLKWKDRGDHIVVESKSVLGDIIISGQPNSDKVGITIRWGGELKHKVMDGIVR